jgi:hypothetical protein
MKRNSEVRYLGFNYGNQPDVLRLVDRVGERHILHFPVSKPVRVFKDREET